MPIVAIAPADKTRPQVNLIRLECLKLKLSPNKKLNNTVSQSSHLFIVLSIFKLHIKLKVPYTNKVSNDILIGLSCIFAFSLGCLIIKNIISRALIPNPEKYVLTSSWFDTVKLNQGEATATDSRKSPINNSLIFFFKIVHNDIH